MKLTKILLFSIFFILHRKDLKQSEQTSNSQLSHVWNSFLASFFFRKKIVSLQRSQNMRHWLIPPYCCDNFEALSNEICFVFKRICPFKQVFPLAAAFSMSEIIFFSEKYKIAEIVEKFSILKKITQKKNFFFFILLIKFPLSFSKFGFYIFSRVFQEFFLKKKYLGQK